jgi:ATP-binding cassette, subfamily G (WHITE), eye pigment precursor transporter
LKFKFFDLKLSITNDSVRRQGYICPATFNPAEFIINNLAIIPSRRQQSIEKVKSICQYFETSSFASKVKEEINEINTIQRKTIGTESTKIVNKKPSSLVNNYKNNSFIQLKWLMWRSFLSISRNPMLTKIKIGEILIYSIYTGLVYFNQQLTQPGVQNINSLLFLNIVEVNFFNCVVLIDILQDEMPILFNENRNGMYRIFYYYISKFITDVPQLFMYIYQ